MAVKAFQSDAAGGTVRYHDLPGTGLPLVMLHGIGCASSFDYPHIVADPSLAGRRAILIDLPGHGYSGAPADFNYTMMGHAHLVADLVHGLDAPAVDLFGHSMGGTIAILAARLLGGTVAQLVLGEPNLDAGGGYFSRKIATFSEHAYVMHGHAMLIGEARSEGNDDWAASLAVANALAVYRCAVSLIAGTHPSYRDTLHALAIPRHVLFGAASLPDPDADRLSASGIRVAIVPDAGHSMARENPGGFAAALCDALA